MYFVVSTAVLPVSHDAANSEKLYVSLEDSEASAVGACVRLMIGYVRKLFPVPSDGNVNESAIDKAALLCEKAATEANPTFQGMTHLYREFYDIVNENVSSYTSFPVRGTVLSLMVYDSETGKCVAGW